MLVQLESGFRPLAWSIATYTIYKRPWNGLLVIWDSTEVYPPAHPGWIHQACRELLCANPLIQAHRKTTQWIVNHQGHHYCVDDFQEIDSITEVIEEAYRAYLQMPSLEQEKDMKLALEIEFNYDRFESREEASVAQPVRAPAP